MEISDIVKKQREYFYSGKTRSYEARINSLKRLRASVTAHENTICEALFSDFRKSAYETYMCEIALVLDEIDYQIRHLRSFMRKRRAHTSLAQGAASYPQPSGSRPHPFRCSRQNALHQLRGKLRTRRRGAPSRRPCRPRPDS